MVQVVDVPVPHRSHDSASQIYSPLGVRPRGALSEALLYCLAGPPGPMVIPSASAVDPLKDDDEALALYLCYELTYRGIPGCDNAWEWEPGLIAFRALLERRFIAALECAIRPEATRSRSALDVIRRLSEGDSPSLSRYLEEQGSLRQFRELAVHRSAYQLKEADPHTWAIPRLTGSSKAALVFIQYEEYGEGVVEEMHSSLFADTMRGLGLSDAYGAYLDEIPGVTLSTVNLISLFGLHRRWRGALVGHLALFEMTSTEPNGRYAAGLRRLGADAQTVKFFDAHVMADATHEVVALEQLAGGLIADEPGLDRDVAFGALALARLDRMFADHLLSAWERGETSLLSGR